jgi:hypothetical protein
MLVGKTVDGGERRLQHVVRSRLIEEASRSNK